LETVTGIAGRLSVKGPNPSFLHELMNKVTTIIAMRFLNSICLD
jgi:hypothetical protein